MKPRLLLAGLVFLAVAGAVGFYVSLDTHVSPRPLETELPDDSPLVVQASTTEPDPEQAQPSVTDPDPAVPVGHSVVRLQIPRLAIDANVIVLGVDNAGAMAAPATPTDVAWYDFSSKPGQGGNIVMAGHVDFARYGPAVFWRLRELRAEDMIQLLLDDNSVASYRVKNVAIYNDSTAPVDDIVGWTPDEAVTLITCDGVFNPVTHQYDKRLIVRAVRT